MPCYPEASDPFRAVSGDDVITPASTIPHSNVWTAIEEAFGLSPFDTSIRSNGSLWER